MDANNKSYQTIADLVPYVCDGADRPDDNPTYVEGIPEGLVCADVGAVGDAIARGYCCSPKPGPCALNPTAECALPATCKDKDPAICDDRYYNFECKGGMRPEVLNSSLFCRNGVVNEPHIDYCCRDVHLPQPLAVFGTACTEVTGTPKAAADGSELTCNSTGLTAFTCPSSDPSIQPTTDTLDRSKSRADFYAPICTKVGTLKEPMDFYCCYTPKLPPAGATCWGDSTVPNCTGGRFGFSCYGPDTPADDFIPFSCPEPGLQGKNQYGYDATLYCCDYAPTPDASL